MSERHPSRASLLRFFLGTSSASDADPVVAHLLPECAACAQTISTFWPSDDRSADLDEADLPSEIAELPSVSESARPEDFTEVVDRVLGDVSRVEREVNEERADAARCLPRILRQPFERQLMLVRNSPRFRSWACCEGLVDASFERRHDDPREAERLARVAVAAASLLDPARYGLPLVRDLQGRSWTTLASACRVRGDFEGAAQALQVARALLRQGTGSPIDEAWACDVEASFYSVRRQYDRALASIGRSIRIYNGLNERHLLGRALIQKGMICGYDGHMDCNIVFTRSGLGLVDTEQDPRVGLAGWHNLCWALHERGEDRQALSTLVRARPLYLSLGDRSNLLRFQWLEGLIATSLGRDEQAEGCLREAQEGFVELSSAFDAAFVSLDLATLLVRQGRSQEVCHLAAEAIAVFEAHESRQEALAALILLRQAAERERVTEALLKRVGSSLREAQQS